MNPKHDANIQQRCSICWSIIPAADMGVVLLLGRDAATERLRQHLDGVLTELKIEAALPDDAGSFEDNVAWM